MLRVSADRRTLGFVAIYFALLISAWIVQPSGVLTAIWVGALAVFSFFCAVITHNTVHVPVFQKRWHNQLFQYLLTLSYGHAVSAYVPGHNLSHHVHVQTRKDVMRTTKARFGWNLLNQLLFPALVGPAIMKAEWQYAKVTKSTDPAWYKQMVSETLVLTLLQITVLLVDWQRALLFLFLPHMYAAWGIIGINFVQHDGCDETSPYNHSRNFVGHFVNWWTFNNGFHGMHHQQPGLHWSKLPEAHKKELSPHLHPALEQSSLFLYLIHAYIWPGKRTRYDGAPLLLPSEGPDEDWIAANHSQTSNDVTFANARFS